MFYCEICGNGNCCERTDIPEELVLCDSCYQEFKKMLQDDNIQKNDIYSKRLERQSHFIRIIS